MSEPTGGAGAAHDATVLVVDNVAVEAAAQPEATDEAAEDTPQEET